MWELVVGARNLYVSSSNRIEGATAAYDHAVFPYTLLTEVDCAPTRVNYITAIVEVFFRQKLVFALPGCGSGAFFQAIERMIGQMWHCRDISSRIERQEITYKKCASGSHRPWFRIWLG